MENFEVEIQIRNLGLEKIIENYKDISLLDIGCGRKMALSRYLQEQGFEAEGLDSCPRKNYPGLIKQKITETFPNHGCIPRNEENYYLVTSHQNPTLTPTLTCLRNTFFLESMWGIKKEKLMKKYSLLATKIIYEMERVTKKEGAIIIFPALDIIQEYLGNFLKEKNINVIHKKVDNLDPSDALVHFDYHYEDCSSSFEYRTILYRENTLKKIRENLDI